MENGPIYVAVQCITTGHATSPSREAGNAQACALMELAHAAGGRECYGVGIDSNIVTASIKALLSGVNRLEAVRCETVVFKAA